MNADDRARLQDLVKRFADTRVVALADLVADEFLLCRTSRISREAPAALILEFQGREVRPGGGANAVANLRALGASVSVLGIVGDDEMGFELRRALEGAGVDVEGVRVERGYRTVVKSRVLTRYHHSTRQQVLRIDREDRLPPASPALGLLADAARARLDGAAALLISDYGYGAAGPEVTRRVTEEARVRGLPIAVDSRYDLLRHPRPSAVLPNEPEVEEALGMTIGDDLVALERGGRDLLSRLACEAVLVTRGSRGCALFEPGKPTELIPVFGSDEIADVTGAGDTVSATYTLALAAGASHREAALLANVAGGLVVLKAGTATVSRKELEEALGAVSP